MAGPAASGRWLEPIGNDGPRQMAVDYRIRLTDLLTQKERTARFSLFISCSCIHAESLFADSSVSEKRIAFFRRRTYTIYRRRLCVEYPLRCEG